MSVKYENVLATMASFFLFALAFWLGPVQFSDYFTKIPGDLGDSRLNAYFLENVYQYLFGTSDSLWHLGFYYPFPYVLGFSDNLFGLSPLFVALRLAGIDAYTSFLYWFMSGYLLNFVACLYALRKIGLSPWAAGLGALVFTFGLPVTAHSGHAQLHHRFAIPLAVYCFVQFLQSKQIRYLLFSYFWLVWQFFIGVYMGFFAGLFLATMTMTYVAIPYVRNKQSLRVVGLAIADSVRSSLLRSRAAYTIAAIALTLSLVWLFYPYMEVKELYGFSRSFSDMRGMLPRLYSYIYAPFSNLWGFKWEYFSKLPVWWEHQMFPGMVPFVLTIVGLVIGFRRSVSLPFRLVSCSFIFLFCLTLSTGGSWWEYVAHLPLFSAIRAVSRIDMLYLLVYGFLAGYCLDNLTKNTRAHIAISLILSILFVYESSEMKTFWNKIDRWRLKEAALAKLVPNSTSPNSVLFFAQQGNLAYEHEISAMWVALKKGHRTINGYSGNGPRGYSNSYRDDCGELYRRLAIYEEFAVNASLPARNDEKNRQIVPIGFKNCPQKPNND